MQGQGQASLLLVSGNGLFRECLSSGLTSRVSHLDVQLATTVAFDSGSCIQRAYDLVVLDADPPDPVTPSMTRRLREQQPSTRVMVMGRARNEDEVIAFLEAGASDFRFTDSESLEDFGDAVERALEGQVLHGPERTRALFNRLQKLSSEVERMKTIDGMILTEREMEILRLIDEGLSNMQIAKTLHISLHTVKNHVHRILEKLQVSNRRQAVHLAYNNGWIKVAAS